MPACLRYNGPEKENLDKKIDETTMHVGFSYDLSCNLQCPSCRDGLIMWDPYDPEDSNGQRVRQIHEKVKLTCCIYWWSYCNA